MTPSGPHPQTLRRYRYLLRAFPSDFRAAYEADLVDAFVDAWRERARGGDVWQRLAFWWETARDVVGSGLAERWARLRGRSGPVPPRRPGSGVEARSWGVLLELFVRELRLALRSLRRRPGFTAAVVLILGVSVAAATTLWGTVYHVAVAPLGFEDEDELVAVWFRVRRASTDADFAVSDGLLVELRNRSRTLQSLTAIMGVSRTAVLDLDDGTAERVPSARVLPNFFRVLGVRPALGRTFAQGEGEADIVLLSHEAWRTRFGRDDGILGHTVHLNGTPHEIVGVLPEGFVWSETAEQPEFWRSTALQPSRFSPFYFYAVGRLRPGATPADAQREAHVVFTDVSDRTDADPARRPDPLASVRPLREELLSTEGPHLEVLAGALGFVLLLGTANVAVLMLIRTVGRARESALRVAMGGGATRAAAPLLAELFLLFTGGGLVAVALSWTATTWISGQTVVQMPRMGSVSLSLPVLAGGLAIALVCTVAVAAVVGVGLRRWGGRAILQAMADPVTGGRLPRPLRAPLIVAQVALSMVLLGGAALLGRSFVELSAVDTGFITDSVLQAGIRLPTEPLWEPVEGVETVVVDERSFDWEMLRVTPAMAGLHADLRSRLAAHPAVTEVTLAKHTPLSGRYGAFTPLVPEWFRGEEGEMPGGRRWISHNAVAPDFLPFLGVELVRGRWLTDEDDATAPRVALVSEDLARNLWPRGDALGSRFRSWSFVAETQDTVRQVPGWTTVVGIVRPLREWDIRTAEETVYTPLAQDYALGTLVAASGRGPVLRLFLRHRGEAGAVAEHVRGVVSRLLPGTPVDDLRTLDDVVASQLREPRFLVALFLAFGAVALVLALGGIAAVVGYGVSRRTQEIGLRMALGARSGRVFRLIAAETLSLVGLGVLLGLAATWAAGRTLDSLLFEVRPWDPLSLAVTAVLFTAMALLAAWFPARRATSIDPARTLRYE